MDSNGYYSFNEDTLPYTGLSETFNFDEPAIGMAASGDFSSFYSFNEDTLPHAAVTNAFALDDSTNDIAVSASNYSVDHDALDQTLTDSDALLEPNWQGFPVTLFGLHQSE